MHKTVLQGSGDCFAVELLALNATGIWWQQHGVHGEETNPFGFSKLLALFGRSPKCGKIYTHSWVAQVGILTY